MKNNIDKKIRKYLLNVNEKKWNFALKFIKRIVYAVEDWGGGQNRQLCYKIDF
jgi:hypothetical protein